MTPVAVQFRHLTGVCVKDAKSWEFLRVFPEIMKMRSWRQEVEESLCSGREANMMRMKQCVYCIRNVYDVVDLDFLEGAYLLQVLRKVNLNCGLLKCLRILRKLCEAKEKVAKLSTQTLRGLRELCEAFNSNECEIRGCEAFVSNAPRHTLTLRSSQL